MTEFISWFITDIEARILQVVLDLSGKGDPTYTKEMAVKELKKIANILNETKYESVDNERM